MYISQNSFLEKFVPFLIAGVGLVLFVGMLILLSYILVLGLAIGVILWAVFTIKDKYFARQKYLGHSDHP